MSEAKERIDESDLSDLLLRWIPIDEAYPDAETDVVLYPDYAGDPVVGFWCSGDCKFIDGDGRYVPSVTHWQPLAPLPGAQ